MTIETKAETLARISVSLTERPVPNAQEILRALSRAFDAGADWYAATITDRRREERSLGPTEGFDGEQVRGNLTGKPW